MATAMMDLFAGEIARDHGLALAAECRNDLVNKIREHLTLVARSKGNRCVTADDYTDFLIAIGSSNKELGNAAGAIFRHPDWEFTGLRTPSRRKSNHARDIKVWRLK
jgi:hypothetical protein